MCKIFNGWRRKTGCITLLLGIMFSLAWMQSYLKPFKVLTTLEEKRPQTSVGSAAGTLFHLTFDSSETSVDWTIPYWSIVVALTLLSTYLLLWKTRKPTSAPKQS